MEISTIEMRDVTAGRAPPYREGKHIPSYFYNFPGMHVYLPVHLLTVNSIDFTLSDVLRECKEKQNKI